MGGILYLDFCSESSSDLYRMNTKRKGQSAITLCSQNTVTRFGHVEVIVRPCGELNRQYASLRNEIKSRGGGGGGGGGCYIYIYIYFSF